MERATRTFVTLAQTQRFIDHNVIQKRRGSQGRDINW